MSRDSNVQNLFGFMFRGSESKSNIELKSETNQNIIESRLSLKRSSITNSVNSIRSSISILSNDVNPISPNINIEEGVSVFSPQHNIEVSNTSNLFDDTYELDEFYEEAIIVKSESLQEIEETSPGFFFNDRNSGQEVEKKSADVLPQGTSPISPKIQISPISISE